MVTDPSAMHGVLNGTLRGLSISYVPRREKVDEGIIKVDDFELCEVSLCAQPANKDCFIRVCQEVRLKP